jgi:hypothetical protein
MYDDAITGTAKTDLQIEALMFFPMRHKVAERLEKHGGEIVDFQFEERGLQTWRVPK